MCLFPIAVNSSCQINKVISHPTLPISITAHEDRHIKFYDNNTGKHPLPLVRSYGKNKSRSLKMSAILMCTSNYSGFFVSTDLTRCRSTNARAPDHEALCCFQVMPRLAIHSLDQVASECIVEAFGKHFCNLFWNTPGPRERIVRLGVSLKRFWKCQRLPAAGMVCRSKIGNAVLKFFLSFKK